MYRSWCRAFRFSIFWLYWSLWFGCFFDTWPPSACAFVKCFAQCGHLKNWMSDTWGSGLSPWAVGDSGTGCGFAIALVFLIFLEAALIGTFCTFDFSHLFSFPHEIVTEFFGSNFGLFIQGWAGWTFCRFVSPVVRHGYWNDFRPLSLCKAVRKKDRKLKSPCWLSFSSFAVYPAPSLLLESETLTLLVTLRFYSQKSFRHFPIEAYFLSLGWLQLLPAAGLHPLEFLSEKIE